MKNWEVLVPMISETARSSTIHGLWMFMTYYYLNLLSCAYFGFLFTNSPFLHLLAHHGQPSDHVSWSLLAPCRLRNDRYGKPHWKLGSHPTQLYLAFVDLSTGTKLDPLYEANWCSRSLMMVVLRCFKKDTGLAFLHHCFQIGCFPKKVN